VSAGRMAGNRDRLAPASCSVWRAKTASPHLPDRASDRAMSMMSSRPVVGSSLFQATPWPMRKSLWKRILIARMSPVPVPATE
jgi:hypothetical protein